MTPSPPTTTALLDWALYYASHGFRVHPCHHIVNASLLRQRTSPRLDCSCPRSSPTRNKDGVCESAGKHPRLSAWQKKATTDRDQITRWWTTNFPNANIGIATGPESRLFGIDVDGDGGVEILKEWQENGILPDINTPTDTSGSGYPRLFFRHPGAILKVANRARIATHPTLPGGIDVRGDGGNIIVAPSHNAKGPYAWDPNRVLGQVPLLVPSAKLLELVVEQPRGGSDRSANAGERLDVGAILAGIPEGQRNEKLFKYASSLRGRRFHQEEASLLVNEAMEKAIPPYTQESAEALVARVWKTYAPGSAAIELDAEDFTTEPKPTLPAFPEAAWRGVFNDYRELMTGVSECPMPLHFSNLLLFIAAFMGNLFVLDEAKPTTANLYVLNVGETGVKKSTATDLAEQYVVRHLPLKSVIESSVSSGEGLVRMLSEDDVVLRYDEIADLLAVSERSGQRLEPLLNQAFDLRRLTVRVKQEKNCLEAAAQSYYFNLIANGTPDHIRLKLAETIMFGGLINRFLVFAAEPTDQLLPFMKTPDEQLARFIASQLTTRRADWDAALFTPATFGAVRVGYSDEARDVFSAWYKRNTMDIRARPNLEAKLLTRLELYVKKLAMIYRFLEHPPDLSPQITGEQMQAATSVIDYCKDSMLWMTRDWTGPKTVQQQSQAITEQRIEAYLREKGCMSERRLYSNLHIGAKECTSAVDAMNGIVVHVVKGRPSMVHLLKCKCFRKEEAA